MSELKYITRLFLLLAIQVIILNQINFLGFASPMLCLLFFITYPNYRSKSSLLFIAFVAGLVIDTFSDTGGIYAASLLLVVFFRPIFLRLFLNQKEDIQEVNLFQVTFFNRVIYTLCLAFIFHASFYLFEYLSVSHWIANFLKILICTILTSLVCLLGLHLFIPFKK